MPLTEAEELELLELEAESMSSWQAQQHTHLPPRIPAKTQVRVDLAEQLGVPFSSLDPANRAGFGTRVGQGLFSDSPQEEYAFAEQAFPPGSRIAQSEGYTAIRPPEGPPVFLNPPGFDRGDVGEFMGRTGPAVAAGGAGVLATGVSGFSGPVAPVVGGAAGVAAEGAVREGLQSLVGTQRETFPEVGTRVGIDAVTETIPLIGKGAKTLFKALRGRGQDELARALKGSNDEDIGALIAELNQTEGIGLPDLMNFQKSDNPVLQRIAYQSMQMSGKAQARLASQLNELAAAAKRVAPGTGQAASADEIIQALSGQHYREQYAKLAPEIDAATGGLALQQGVREGLRTRKDAMRAAYDRLDTVIGNQTPTYDISGARSAAKRRYQEGMVLADEEAAELFRPAGPGVVPGGAQVTGEPLGETTFKHAKFINVADPGSKLNRINAVISQLDPTQDYATLKELRSQVGHILDLPLAKKLESGVDIGKAKQIYGELSEALLDPQGVVPAARKGIIRRTKEANQAALRYYDTYDNDQVGRVLSSIEGQTPVGAFDELARNPVAWEDSFIEVLNDAKNKPKVLGNVRRNVNNVLMRSEDPWATMQSWKDRNENALKWLYPDAQKRARAEQNAKTIRHLRRSTSKEAGDEAFTRVGFALKDLQDHMKTSSSRGASAARQGDALLGKYGGPGSVGHQALRQATMTEVIEKSLRTHERTGNLALDPKVLSQEIERYRRSGVWGSKILTPRDRKALSALNRYAKTTWKSGDAGTGLAVASQIGQLRGGDPGAVMSIRIAASMGDLLTRTDLPYQSLMRKIGKGSSPLTDAVTSTIFRTLRQGVIAPEIEEQVSGP